MSALTGLIPRQNYCLARPVLLIRQSGSQPPKIKTNHRELETISALLRAHRLINHSCSALWTQLAHCCLCSPSHSVLHIEQEWIQSFGEPNRSSYGRWLNLLHSYLFTLSQTEPVSEQAPWKCVWMVSFLIAKKADTVSTPLTSRQQNVSQTSFLGSRLLSGPWGSPWAAMRCACAEKSDR